MSAERIQWMVQKCLDCSAKASFEIIETAFTTDLRPELREIAVPTLIIHGTADASADIDLCGRRTSKLVPGNTYKEYPNTGHGIMITHAEQLNADLLEFIKS